MGNLGSIIRNFGAAAGQVEKIRQNPLTYPQMRAGNGNQAGWVPCLGATSTRGYFGGEFKQIWDHRGGGGGQGDPGVRAGWWQMSPEPSRGGTVARNSRGHVVKPVSKVTPGCPWGPWSSPSEWVLLGILGGLGLGGGRWMGLLTGVSRYGRASLV